ncbi:rhodanese-like domain-containing protein [Yimella sp. NH-Cas1]|uniref:rhodanese-like domain-containing protein n=1 Tax=Yimella sp. NH-Cas1 TaxID=2917726 RepID=UPI001EFAE03F|nr:rhodanese-like domain-containing protein [Yimella sp. NH-Cas1]MCG8656836.1 rhodanese-like domain-containing protein [Yimella sp. NH-Cas1]
MCPSFYDLTGDAESIDRRLATARESLTRVEPQDLTEWQDDVAFVIDIRPEASRRANGHIPGAVVIDRSVLEWRLDPTSGYSMSDGPTKDDVVVVVCNEGYSSSLAASDLKRLGFRWAADLVGGFRGYVEAGLPIDEEPTRVVE